MIGFASRGHWKDTGGVGSVSLSEGASLWAAYSCHIPSPPPPTSPGHLPCTPPPPIPITHTQQQISSEFHSRALPIDSLPWHYGRQLPNQPHPHRVSAIQWTTTGWISILESGEGAPLPNLFLLWECCFSPWGGGCSQICIPLVANNTLLYFINFHIKLSLLKSLCSSCLLIES